MQAGLALICASEVPLVRGFSAGKGKQQQTTVVQSPWRVQTCLALSCWPMKSTGRGLQIRLAPRVRNGDICRFRSGHPPAGFTHCGFQGTREQRLISRCLMIAGKDQKGAEEAIG
jgi:hypothetical protein